MKYLLPFILMAVFLFILWFWLRSWQKKEQAEHIVYLRKIGINAAFDKNGQLHVIRPETKNE